MLYKVELEQFQGPFVLLLRLIEKEQLDITEISLAKITEQYIKHLEQIEQLYPEELADFLVVATKLLLIKSRSMLPYLQVENEEGESNLEEQLKIYKEFYEAAQVLERIIKQKHFTYSRIYKTPEPVFTPPKKISSEKLKKYYQDVLASLEPVVKIPESAIKKAVTLKEKIVNLQAALKQQSSLSFKDMVSKSENKTDVIITFLALLELVKKQSIAVKQNNNFEDIMIEKI